MSSNNRCDPSTLVLVLDQRNDQAQYDAAVEHVETCPECQQHLEELAADRWWWTEGRELVRASAAICIDSYPSTSGLIEVEPSGGGGAAAPVEHVPPLDFLDPPTHPELLGRLGKYEIEKMVGRGGMGVVFKGFDAELNRTVAIKVLSPHLASSGAARQRFLREARAAAAVVHEHVVAIHGIDSTGELPYLVMPYIAGESLQRHVDRCGPLDVKDIVRISMQIASGLAAAHQQGLVHRDVKPANILLENGFGRVLITDFGLARAADDASLTRTGLVAGTPHYMSPEQARGTSIDQPSDLFSLGSVMYFMATGRPPFRAEGAMAVLNRICHDPPVPVREVNADIPGPLADIMVRLHDKDPANRFASAAGVHRLLADYLAHLQHPTVHALPEAIGKRREPASRTRFLLLSGLASVCLAMALASAFWPGKPNPPAERAAAASRATASRTRETVVTEIERSPPRVRLSALMPAESLDRELNSVEVDIQAMEVDMRAASVAEFDRHLSSWQMTVEEIGQRIDEIDMAVRTMDYSKP